MFEHLIAYFIVTANKTSIFMQPYVSSDRMCFLGSAIEVSLRNNNCNSQRDKKNKVVQISIVKDSADADLRLFEEHGNCCLFDNICFLSLNYK